MSLDRAIELQQRCWSLQSAGRLDEARLACREALELMEGSDGLVSPDVANLLNDLADIEHERCNWQGAMELAERAQSVEDALADRLTGEAAARIRLRTLARLGATRRAQGDYTGAERDLMDALRLSVDEFGGASEEVAQTRNDLAVLYKYSGRFDEGLRLYEQALASMVAIHGEESLACAAIYHNIGGILHARGDFAAAEAPGRKAWDISRRLLGDNDWRALLDGAAYAAILEGLKRYDESETIYRLALSGFEKTFGPAHPEIATTLHNLAAVLAIRGDWAGADRHYRRSLAMKETLFGGDHPEVALTCNNLGRLLLDLGRREGAVPLLERAVAILERRFPTGHPHPARARQNLRNATEVPIDTSRMNRTLHRVFVWLLIAERRH